MAQGDKGPAVAASGHVPQPTESQRLGTVMATAHRLTIRDAK
jgi:hypothetical protein